MATTTRIYIAKKGETVRLINASTPAECGRHLASEWSIKVADVEDVLQHRDIDVEQAKTDGGQAVQP